MEWCVHTRRYVFVLHAAITDKVDAKRLIDANSRPSCVNDANDAAQIKQVPIK